MRLIDGDALWEKLDDEPWFDNADRDEVALPIVNAAPTVDAEVVVRCKDCKFNSGAKKCLNPNSFIAVPADDDFCSYGEKRA